MITLTTSPQGSFRTSQLAHSVVICEAVKGDKYDWGNATDGKPAFIAYVGCSKDEVKNYVRTFNSSYQCEW